MADALSGADDTAVLVVAAVRRAVTMNSAFAARIWDLQHNNAIFGAARNYYEHQNNQNKTTSAAGRAK
jgi:hypothetical protein